MIANEPPPTLADFPAAVAGHSNGFVLLDPSEPLNIPATVALCPYCGGLLYAQFDAWEQQADGTWAAESVHLDCENEPPMPEDERGAAFETWEAWIDWHANMPYVYWLPVCEIVEDWINQWYRFALNDN